MPLVATVAVRGNDRISAPGIPTFPKLAVPFRAFSEQDSYSLGIYTGVLLCRKSIYEPAPPKRPVSGAYHGFTFHIYVYIRQLYNNLDRC